MINNIEKYRKIKKITQEELARAVSISLTQLRNIEKNRCIPSVEIGIKIMKKLEVKFIEDLFEIEENPFD